MFPWNTVRGHAKQNQNRLIAHSAMKTAALTCVNRCEYAVLTGVRVINLHDDLLPFPVLTDRNSKAIIQKSWLRIKHFDGIITY
ncbi:MAG: hypothetical protein CR997_05685 [Acidobacteria bacterium]|nr:MAG: hypothetical protein CR997_05685 [Acidobacteriota bacterium]